MSNDKMREEFEAAFVKQFGFGRMAASANADAAGMLMCAEWAWKASRESLVIELPSYGCFGQYSEEAARVMRDGCADAIEETGAKWVKL